MNKNDPFFKNVGANVRYYREKCGFSQEKLAIRANTNDRYISSIERGLKNITLETLQRLSKALEIDTYVLLLPRKKKT